MLGNLDCGGECLPVQKKKYTVNNSRRAERRHSIAKQKDKFTYKSFMAKMLISLKDEDNFHTSPKWEIDFCQKRFIAEGGTIEECNALYRDKGRLDLIKVSE